MARIHGSLLGVSSRVVETRHGPFRVERYLDLARRRPALAITRGTLTGGAPLVARVHSSCFTSELLGGCDCDCAEQLSSALARVADEDRGVLFYLLQEGRGAGFVAKARDRMMVQASGDRLTTFEAYDRLGLPHDLRRYREVADIRAHLGITAPLVLLTNNPDKVARIEREKVPVAGTEPLHHLASPWNRHYLASKSRSGHALSLPDESGPAPLPPFRVTWHDPVAVPGDPRFVCAASYALAVRPLASTSHAQAAAGWLRLSVFADRRTGAARVLLSGNEDRSDAERRVLPHGLLDRLPLAAPGARRRALARDVETIARKGSGRVLLLDADEAEPLDAATRALLTAPLA